jgi:hypothetical protein
MKRKKNHMLQTRHIVRRSRLDEQGQDDDLRDTTPAERIGMMWQLTLDAWAFKGESIAQSRLSRHIVHLLRRTG